MTFLKGIPSPILALILVSILGFTYGVTEPGDGLSPPSFGNTETPELSWAFVYYMSFDNNLDEFAEKILNEMERGVEGEQIAAVVQKDVRQTRQMQRIIFRGNTDRRQVMQVESDNSASIAEFRAFLDWVRVELPAEKYVITIMNHGGDLNQMCLDESTGIGDRAGWLSGHDVALALEDFNEASGDRLELLFLQQCGRAMLENLYSFSRSADYTLASQFFVGAPNTYYTGLMRAVSRRVAVDPISIAESIMALDQHYFSYTLVSNQALRELPTRLGRLTGLLEPIQVIDRRSLRYSMTYIFEKEWFFDIELALRGLAPDKREDLTREVRDFTSWLRTELVLRHSTGEWARAKHLGRSGISVFIPPGEPQLWKYSDMPYFKDRSLAAFSRVLAKKYGSTGTK